MPGSLISGSATSIARSTTRRSRPPRATRWARCSRRWDAEAEARTQYETAARLDPLAGYAHNNLCYGWILEGDADRAVQACRRALSLDPSSPVAHNNAGLAYALSGDLPAARAAFAQAGSRAAAAFNSGMVNLAAGQWDHASKDFLDALAADPSLRSAAVRARQAQNMKNGDTK